MCVFVCDCEYNMAYIYEKSKVLKGLNTWMVVVLSSSGMLLPICRDSKDIMCVFVCDCVYNMSYIWEK